MMSLRNIVALAGDSFLEKTIDHFGGFDFERMNLRAGVLEVLHVKGSAHWSLGVRMSRRPLYSEVYSFLAFEYLDLESTV